MREYQATGFRVLAGGSIEVEGRWTWERWIALGLLPVMLIGLRSPTVLGVVAALALYLSVFPTRRRAVFDLERARLRGEHAGIFAEKSARTIPFAELTGIEIADAGRRGGRAQRAIYARAGARRVYLVTYAGPANELADRLTALLA